MIINNTKKSNSNFGLSAPAYEKAKPIFSFENFRKDTEFYTKEHSNSDKNSLLNFLNASKDFCSLTWGEIKKNKQFHAHDVEKNIPELNNASEGHSLFQFKLPNHDKGRFVGYFDHNCVFRLLIYDRNHQVYARK